jgi:hypothetical protein
MTLDPRTQLAHTMVAGLTSQQEPRKQKRKSTIIERDRLGKEQERRSMEALTQALLDPCTTVQEAVLHSLLQRTSIHSPSWNKKDGGSE